MTDSGTPWTVVLGVVQRAGVSTVFSGPAGPAGLTGPQGPQGVQGDPGGVVGQDATFFLDSPDAGIVNGLVIHRGLGPDRVPEVPDPADDEMITAGTGYNPAKWDTSLAGTETYHFDEQGGLRIDVTDGDSLLHMIEQDCPDGEFSFTAKISNAAPMPGVPSNNEFIGIHFRNVTSGRKDIWYVARRDQTMKIIRSKLSDLDAFISDTFSSWPDPTAFYYLRVLGSKHTIAFQVSTNGLTFVTLETTTLYCADADKIGLFVYGNEAINWSGYIQWWRKTA